MTDRPATAELRVYLADNGTTLLCRGCNQKALSANDPYHDMCMKRVTTPAATTPDNIDDRIDAWHDGDGQDQPLHEYLGWTREQYAAWVERGEFPDA